MLKMNSHLIFLNHKILFERNSTMEWLYFDDLLFLITFTRIKKLRNSIFLVIKVNVKFLFYIKF